MQNVTKLDGHFAVKGGQLFSSRMHKQRSMDSRLFAICFWLNVQNFPLFKSNCTGLSASQLKNISRTSILWIASTRYTIQEILLKLEEIVRIVVRAAFGYCSWFSFDDLLMWPPLSAPNPAESFLSLAPLFYNHSSKNCQCTSPFW